MFLLLDPLPGRLLNGPQLEVLQPVVITDAVLVMDLLGGQQVTTEMLLHHEPVLQYIFALTGYRRMRGIPNLDIATFPNYPAAFPTPRIARSPSIWISLAEGNKSTPFRTISHLSCFNFPPIRRNKHLLACTAFNRNNSQPILRHFRDRLMPPLAALIALIFGCIPTQFHHHIITLT